MQLFQYKLVDDGTFCIMSYEGDEAEVTIPAVHENKPVTILYDDIFKNHAEITKVNIPDSITCIGGFVFDCCWNLKRITLPPNLMDMWQYAFVRSAIEEIEIPGTVKSIISFTFQDCINLKKVVCHEGLERIRAWAFKGCINLEEIEIPSGVEVSAEAFQGCNKLKFDI